MTVLYIACSVLVVLILAAGLIDFLFGERLRRELRFLEGQKTK